MDIVRFATNVRESEIDWIRAWSCQDLRNGLRKKSWEHIRFIMGN